MYVGDDQRLHVYDDYDEFIAHEQHPDLAAAVAESLGEKYVYELDI